jgi:hypothetical protein
VGGVAVHQRLRPDGSCVLAATLSCSTVPSCGVIPIHVGYVYALVLGANFASASLACCSGRASCTMCVSHQLVKSAEAAP